MLASSRPLPLLAEPTAPSIDSLASPTPPDTLDAEPSEDWGEDAEVTRRRVDLPRALGELLALVSRVESLASAAERALDALPWGPTAGYARRGRRVVDLLVATREAALRALEVGDALRSEVTRPA